MTNLDELLSINAEHALKLQSSNGSFPAGHNGPYIDPETPVRNTAHFLFLLSSQYGKLKDERYKVAAEKAVSYLESHHARPYKKTFFCRNKVGKDKCNGLVGQAWVIEALVKAYDVFGWDRCYKLAEDVFLLHPWNGEVFIWNRVEVCGEVLSVDRTFNHQLWFAMSASLLIHTPLAVARAKSFLIEIVSKVETYDDGVIYHNSQLGRLNSYWYLGFKMWLAQLKANFLKKNIKKQLYLKSVGYHGFNLYAISVMKKSLPEEKIWETDLIRKLVESCDADTFIRSLEKSEYGYFYNTAGIEIAYANEVLLNSPMQAQVWFQRQVDYTWDVECMAFVNNVPDKSTSLARVYVAARFESGYQNYLM